MTLRGWKRSSLVQLLNGGRLVILQQIIVTAIHQMLSNFS